MLLVGDEYYVVYAIETASGLTIEDCEIYGGILSPDNTTVRRSHTHAGPGMTRNDGFQFAASHVLLEDNLFDGLAPTPGAHVDGIQDMGGVDVVIRHNWIDPSAPPVENGGVLDRVNPRDRRGGRVCRDRPRRAGRADRVLVGLVHRGGAALDAGLGLVALDAGPSSPASGIEADGAARGEISPRSRRRDRARRRISATSACPHVGGSKWRKLRMCRARARRTGRTTSAVGSLRSGARGARVYP